MTTHEFAIKRLVEMAQSLDEDVALKACRELLDRVIEDLPQSMLGPTVEA